METLSCNRVDRPPLATVTSNPAYASQVSAVVQSIAEASDEPSVVDLLGKAARQLGADAAAFVSFIRDDGAHESYRFMLACDPVWCHEYQRRGWYAQDPWLQYALNHTEPALASSIPVGSAKQRELSELAKSFGFASTVIVPAPSAGALSRVGVLCLGCAEEGYFEGEGFAPLKVAARGLAMELHEWWIARIKGELIANAGVTDDDLELLHHERMGHSTKTIALACDASPSAIDCRFQRLNRKLGVPNRKAAATLAAEYGLI
jgi:DNA-binding CsgD family transcriptional regulator